MPALAIVPLCEMTDGQEADMFVLMTAKEEAKTRDGKPYFRVGFRDALREVSFPVWGDSAWTEACRKEWTPGAFYKVRALFRETSYGPQLDIRKIRLAGADDARDGFDPLMCQSAALSNWLPTKIRSVVARSQSLPCRRRSRPLPCIRTATVSS